MSVEFRGECNACVTGADPIPDVYHHYLHVLLRRVEDVRFECMKEVERYKSWRLEVFEELLDMERQRDSLLDKLEKLKNPGRPAQSPRVGGSGARGAPKE